MEVRMGKILALAQIEKGFQTEVRVRNHRIIADLTPDKGGEDRGPTPPEILVVALAACSAMFAKMFADRVGFSGPITVETEAETPEPPTIVQNFRVRVSLPGLPKEEREKAKAFVERCVVSQTLSVANRVDLTIET